MTFLVTGGAGFIGSNLVDSLLSQGNNVIILDNFCNGKEENICDALLNYPNKCSFYKKDIRDDLQTVFSEGIDCVFHLAALARVQPSIEDPLAFDDVNTHGTLNLLEHCKEYGVKKFVFSSSSSVYGTPHKDVLNGKRGLRESCDAPCPLSPYGLQKLIGEEYCRLYTRIHDIRTACLRYFNVYGERQSIEGAYKLVMGIFAEQMLNNEPLTIVGDGNQSRDFTFVGDVVQANILASEYLDSNSDSQVFNIGNGNNRTVNQIAELFGGSTVHIESRIEPKCTLADNTKAINILGWKPTMEVEDWIPGWIKSVNNEF